MRAIRGASGKIHTAGEILENPRNAAVLISAGLLEKIGGGAESPGVLPTAEAPPAPVPEAEAAEEKPKKKRGRPKKKKIFGGE